MSGNGVGALADLKRAGVTVVRVEDARLGGDIVAARGRSGVRAVELAGGDVVDCDLLVTATGWPAPASLVTMAGGRMAYSQRAARYLPDPAGLPGSVLVSGGLAGDGTLEELIRHATVTGEEAARRSMRARGDGIPRRAATAPALSAGQHPELFTCRASGGRGARGGHGFVDLSEDVTDKDLRGLHDRAANCVVVRV